MKCPKCGIDDKVKNGRAMGRQRYRCKGCRCNYTQSESRGKPKAMKRKALQLYLEGLGFASIGRFLGVSGVSVMRWIRSLAREVRELRSSEPIEHVPIMEVDEVWHYVKKKPKKYGSGSLMIVSEESLLIFSAEAGISSAPRSSGAELRKSLASITPPTISRPTKQ